MMEGFKPLRWIFLSMLPLLMLLSLPSLFSSAKVQAQGTHDCQFFPGGNCNPTNTNCDSGYEPNYDHCAQDDGFGNQDDCNNQTGISCVTSCDSGYFCTNAPPLSCSNGGGYPESCAEGDTTGNCCLPSSTCEIRYEADCVVSSPDRCPPGSGYYPEPLGGYGELGCSSIEQCCEPLPEGCCTFSLPRGCPSDGQVQCPGDDVLYCNDVNDCPDESIFGGGTEAPSPLDQGGCNPDELYTGIGCIPIGDANDFLGFILSWALGLAGGIAFLMIIYSGFQVITSAGDPRKLESGKELLTAAIGGLLLILFAAFILNLIGVDILQIPGFGG